MPKGADKPRGVGAADNAILSGAEQFHVRVEAVPASPPFEVAISFARLSEGIEFDGIANYRAQNSPATTWTNGVLNYVWFRLSQANVGPYKGIESDVANPSTGGFPNDTDVIPLAIIDINGAGAFNAIIDARPWFDGGAGGGANSVSERLKEILQHSVMQNYRFSYIPTNAVPDVGTASNGSFVSPSNYELAPGQQLVSEFTGAALEAPASVEQVTVAVLVDQLILPGDLTIEVARDGVPTFETVIGNFMNHVFTGAAGNQLQIRITNSSAGTIAIKGYGLYYNNIGGPTGVFGDRSGVVLDSSGLNIYNTNPAAFKVSSGEFAFTWVHSTSTLSWAGVGGFGTDLTFEITDPLLGTVTQALQLTGVPATDQIVLPAAPSYVYFDMDRTSPYVTLQTSSGPPVMYRDRFILGKRIASSIPGNPDYVILFNNHILADGAFYPTQALSRYPASLLGQGILEGLVFPSGTPPSQANPFATMANLSGIGGGFLGASTLTANTNSPGTTFTFPVGTRGLIMYSSWIDSYVVNNAHAFGVINVATGQITGWYSSDFGFGSGYSTQQSQIVGPISGYPSGTTIMPYATSANPRYLKIYGYGGAINFYVTGATGPNVVCVAFG